MKYRFDFQWDDDSKTFTDLSSLNPPATVAISVRDGHFYRGDERWYIVGTNVNRAGAFPSRIEAKKLAGHLNKYGINGVRLHNLDGNDGLFDAGWADVNPKNLDALYYLIYQLKKHGIYVFLSLHSMRKFPDFPQYPDGMDGISYFYPPLIEARHELWEQVLGTVNPYTGMELSGDPCLALLQVKNEDSVLRQWASGVFDKADPEYLRLLNCLYNGWRIEEDRYTGKEEALSKRGRSAHREAYQFIVALEREHLFLEKRFLRGLGVSCPLVGPQENYVAPGVTEDMDVCDGHGSLDTAKGRGPWRITNESFVSKIHKSRIARQAQQRDPAKPCIMSECAWNVHKTANEYGLSLMVAAMQDWDGIFLYAWATNRNYSHNWIRKHPINAHPVRMSLLTSMVLAFRTGRVPVLEEAQYATLTEGKVLDIMVDYRTIVAVTGPRTTRSVDYRSMLTRRVGTIIGDKTNIPEYSRKSDWWNCREGSIHFRGNGYWCLYQKSGELGPLRVSVPANVFVSLILMENLPGREKGSYLLTVASHAENADMAWDSETRFSSWGTGPVMCDQVAVDVTGNCRIWELDTKGSRVGEIISDQKNHFVLDKYTMLYEVSAAAGAGSLSGT